MWQPTEHDYALHCTLRLNEHSSVGVFMMRKFCYSAKAEKKRENAGCVLMHFAKRVFVWSQMRETAVPLGQLILFFSYLNEHRLNCFNKAELIRLHSLLIRGSVKRDTVKRKRERMLKNYFFSLFSVENSVQLQLLLSTALINYIISIN